MNLNQWHGHPGMPRFSFVAPSASYTGMIYSLNLIVRIGFQRQDIGEQQERFDYQGLSAS